jgi:hypothetical protein
VWLVEGGGGAAGRSFRSLNVIISSSKNEFKEVFGELFMQFYFPTTMRLLSHCFRMLLLGLWVCML